MSHTWTIERIGGLYHIRRDAGIEMTPASEDQLAGALEPHGIIGERYEDVRRQLKETGKAEVNVTMIRVRQF